MVHASFRRLTNHIIQSSRRHGSRVFQTPHEPYPAFSALTLSLTFARMPIEVRIVNHSNNELPAYATEGSAGLDIRAFIESSQTLQPLQRTMIPTGIFIELPKGYEAQVRPRSGLAVKQGITVLNTPGTIDSDYRGEIKIILINLSAEDQVIQTGDRIAQLVIQKVEQISWTQVENLEGTARNAGGFGHTGKN